LTHLPTRSHLLTQRLEPEHCLGSSHLLTLRPMPSPEKLDMHSDAFLHSLMRKQLKLSIACAVAFLSVLLGLPLANYFWPELMATRILGFTLTWLLLGVCFFPAVWVIALVFVRRSTAMEREVEEGAAARQAVPEEAIR